MTSLRAAGKLIRAGISVVPIRAQEKRPIPSGWQDLRLTEPDLPKHFTNGQNIGALLGDPSGGLIDTDLDAQEARQLAHLFLPPTGMKHGRASAPASHWWYRVEGTVPRRIVYNDPTDPDVDRGMLVEVRGTGHQTIVPPSIHPSGQAVEWDGGTMGEAATTDAATLTRNTGYLAACALLGRHWPGRGMRDELAKDLSGALAHAGWPAGDIDTFIVNAARVAGDEEARMRAKGGHAVRKLEHGSKVTGWPSVAKVLDPRVVDKLREWLGIRAMGNAQTPPPPAIEVAYEGGSYNLTDWGNAQRLVARHGQDLRYCHAWGCWFVWDGTRWVRDADAEVVRRAKDTVRTIYAEATACEDADRRKAIAAHAKSSESESRIRAMISLAESEPDIPVAPVALDRDPYLLNVANGTVDLLTGELRPHEAEDLITKLAAVEYEADAPCPEWERFLETVTNSKATLATYLQRSAGYALTGDTSEQVMYLLHGTGANGKSTLLDTLRYVTGDYAMHTPTDTLMVKRGDAGVPNDLARLMGARFVSAVEAEDGKRLAESLVKQVTGGDPITARFMRAEWFEFTPTFKLFLAANHKPVIRGTDNAIWRRVQLIPFEVTIPEGARDKGLRDKLRAEASGILAWAVRGCLAWQRDGLQAPEEVQAATQIYRAEMDMLAGFIEDRCTTSTGARVPSKALYKAYTDWCEESGERPETQRRLAQRLSERGYVSRKSTGGMMTWFGIGLQVDPQQNELVE